LEERFSTWPPPGKSDRRW